MKFFLTGLSSQTAPVEVRERLAVLPSTLRYSGCRLKIGVGLEEVVNVRPREQEPGRCRTIVDRRMKEFMARFVPRPAVPKREAVAGPPVLEFLQTAACG